jgi:hypothetical protein
MAEPLSPAAPAPPPETAAPFTTQFVLRRLGRRLELDEGSRVFEFGVHGPSASVLLARECGCRFTVADRSREVLDRVRAEADAAGVVGRLTVFDLGNGSPPSLPEGAFELAISPKREMPVALLAALLRPLLVPSRGRLAAVVAARVGLASRDMGLWERALGAALRTPQAELAELMRNGFEPEWAEALSEPQLVELYGARKAPPEEEAALVQSGPAGLSFVLVVGRRREPNEPPPPAREHG